MVEYSHSQVEIIQRTGSIEFRWIGDKNKRFSQLTNEGREEQVSTYSTTGRTFSSLSRLRPVWGETVVRRRFTSGFVLSLLLN